MSNLMTVHTLGPQLMALLGLPPNCLSFQLRCAVGEIVTVECKYIPEGGTGIDAVLAKYELIPRDAAHAPALALHRAEAIGFDAWMAERNECAHQGMLAVAHCRHADR